MRGNALAGFRFVIAPVLRRRRLVGRSAARLPVEGGVPAICRALHPVRQRLCVADVITLSPSTRAYRLCPAGEKERVAPFRAGSYLSVEIELENGLVVRRPYSICSTPSESLENNEYLLAVRTVPGSFAASHIFNTWKKGTTVVASDPRGDFTWEALRDSKNLVFAAGGSGVTPFRSLVGDLLRKHKDVKITLIQGASDAAELLFDQDFRGWESDHPGCFQRLCVISESAGETGFRTDPVGSGAGLTTGAALGNTGAPNPLRFGFIDRNILAEALGESGGDLFICGPPSMHSYIDEQLMKLTHPPRRVRREDYGDSGRPSGAGSFNIAVRDFRWAESRSVPADPGETVLAALERAGLNPPSSCRTGSCGCCRGRLLDGDVSRPSKAAGLRRGDRDLGYFHPCVSKPLSDLLIEIPADSAETDTEV